MATSFPQAEAYTKESHMVEILRGSAGVLAHGMSVERYRRTWETL